MLLSPEPGLLHSVLQQLQANTKLPEGILYLIDIDPVDMM
jgi:hypothetical protein